MAEIVENHLYFGSSPHERGASLESKRAMDQNTDLVPNQLFQTHDPTLLRSVSNDLLARFNSDPRYHSIHDIETLRSAAQSLPLNDYEIQSLLGWLPLLVKESEPRNIYGPFVSDKVIDGLFSIRLLEEAGSEVDCAGFAMGEDGDAVGIMRYQQSGYQVDKPQEGALAFYYPDNEEALSAHVGFATNRGTVISKWTNHGVFEHNPTHYTLKKPIIEYYVGEWTAYMKQQWAHIAKKAGIEPTWQWEKTWEQYNSLRDLFNQGERFLRAVASVDLLGEKDLASVKVYTRTLFKGFSGDKDLRAQLQNAKTIAEMQAIILEHKSVSLAKIAKSGK